MDTIVLLSLVAVLQFNRGRRNALQQYCQHLNRNTLFEIFEFARFTPKSTENPTKKSEGHMLLKKRRLRFAQHQP